MVFGDRLLEAVDPGADHRDYLFRFGLGEFGAPFRDIRDLIDPNGEFRGVVFGFDVPFMGQTGSGIGDELWGGPSEICEVSILGALCSLIVPTFEQGQHTRIWSTDCKDAPRVADLHGGVLVDKS